MAFNKRFWSQLPSRIAMLFGLSAVSVVGAEAGTVSAMPGGEPVHVPQQSAMALNDLLVWQENDRVFMSESGKSAEELRLGDSAQANALRQLLVQQNATAATPHVLHDRIILVGSGGSGLHWESQQPNKVDQKKPSNRSSGPIPGPARTTEPSGKEQSASSADINSK